MRPLLIAALLAAGILPALAADPTPAAVQAFLDGRIGFLGIADLVADAMEAAATRGHLAEAQDAAAVLAIDAATRDLTLTLLNKHAQA